MPGLSDKTSDETGLGGFQVFERASELPEAWDRVQCDTGGTDHGLDGGAVYLTRGFLAFLELVNPCGQRYMLNEALDVKFVTYRLRLNLLNFSRFGQLSVPATVLGVPLSVSAPGFAARDERGRAAMTAWILRQIRGMTVILNVPEGRDFSLPVGLTLSSYVLPLDFDGFEGYLGKMRSPYRRQVKRALEAFQKVEVVELGRAENRTYSGTKFFEAPGLAARLVSEENELFDEALYHLYLEVFHRSKDQLEKLDIAYFRSFPGRTLYFVYQGEKVAFVQIIDEQVRDGKLRHFVLGGFKSEFLVSLDLYRNLLYFLIQTAIEEGCCAINLGQTAAESKAKTGGLEQIKHLYVAHSNPVLHLILGKLVKAFSYKRYETIHHVFK